MPPLAKPSTDLDYHYVWEESFNGSPWHPAMLTDTNERALLTLWEGGQTDIALNYPLGRGIRYRRRLTILG